MESRTPTSFTWCWADTVQPGRAAFDTWATDRSVITGEVEEEVEEAARGREDVE